MRLRQAILLSFILPGSLIFAQAQGDLATDRPGFTSPSATVGLGALQTEQGITFQTARQGGVKTQTVNVPQILVRFGLLKSLEPRFANI